jgi:hypothetical protein
VQEPDDGDEHQRPGRVQDGEHALAADERAQLGQVAQRLGPDRAPGERLANARRQHRLGQAPIEPGADPDQRLVPDRLEQAEHQQSEAGDHGQREQGLDVAARQHAIEHLKHVERRYQHQQINEQAERSDHCQPTPRFAQGGFQGVRLRMLPHGRLGCWLFSVAIAPEPALEGARPRLPTALVCCVSRRRINNCLRELEVLRSWPKLERSEVHPH